MLKRVLFNLQIANLSAANHLGLKFGDDFAPKFPILFPLRLFYEFSLVFFCFNLDPFVSGPWPPANHTSCLYHTLHVPHLFQLFIQTHHLPPTNSAHAVPPRLSFFSALPPRTCHCFSDEVHRSYSMLLSWRITLKKHSTWRSQLNVRVQLGSMQGRVCPVF